MTDEFEQAIRRAAKGLDGGLSVEQPTYHDAWQRGRRRRFRKQAGIAVAGAFVLFAALTVNLGGFPGGETTVETEVASEAQATAVSASPEFVPTTAPVTPPVPDEPTAAATLTQPAESAAPESAPQDETAADEPVAPTAEPVAPPVAAAEAPTTTPVPPAPTAAVEEPVEEPAATATTPPVAALETTDSADTTISPEATAPASSGFDAATTTPDDGPATQTGPVDPDLEEQRTPDEPATSASQSGLPNVTFIGPNQRADAIVLDPAGKTIDGDAGLACDLDRDGTAEATCTLKPAYDCTESAQARPGYLAIDLNEDGAFDQCVALDATACDTTGDGLADTPCTIELQPVEPDPEDS